MTRNQKWLLVATAVVFLLLFLVGCGAESVNDIPNESIDGEIAKVNVEGTTCVVYDASNGGGGVDCNWGTP